MPRLTKLSSEQADPEARQAMEVFIKERGAVPNMFRTVAHRPQIMKTMTEHYNAIMTSGTVGRKLKELIAVRVSYLNHCDY